LLSVFVPVPKRSSVVLALLLFVFLSSLIILGNREIVFQRDVHELSDFAVNALQIERAKHFGELYGNYSRFHFNHPGPAFFYVYAFGERLWLDALGAVPGPYNAHLLTGILLQTGFFVLALLILSELLGRRRVIALGLLIGAFHFGAAGHTFASIWPPEVLIMPFLAFLAAAAAVATGRWSRLPWLVLAGSFLVHGHVAQPLFVVTLALAAYVAGWRAARWVAPPPTAPRDQKTCAHVAAAVVLLVFLTPLLIDLARGAESNAALILRHLQTNVSEDKSLLQSLVYFLSFVTYVETPELIATGVSADGFGLVRAHPGLFILWLLALAVMVAAYWRRRDGEAGLRALVAVWFAATALCAAWGLLQTGPMFAFNGHFYHALHYLVYLLAGTVLLQRLPRLIILPLAALALLVATWGWSTRIRHDPAYADARGAELRAATIAALEADPQPDLPKLLVFERDDWSTAASIALALRRSGHDFRTGPVWRFMFQKRYVLGEQDFLHPEFPYSIWRFVRQPRVEPAVPLPRGPHVVFGPATLPAEQGRIQFQRDGDFTHYHVAGIATPDDRTGAWTNYSHAILQFVPGPATSAVHLQVVAVPFLIPDQIDLQPTELWFNEHRVFAAPFAGPGVLRADIPAAMWNERPIATLRLYVPNAHAPAALGLSGDPRFLALSLEEITTRPVESVPR
jgi:hypothetical protein